MKLHSACFSPSLTDLSDLKYEKQCLDLSARLEDEIENNNVLLVKQSELKKMIAEVESKMESILNQHSDGEIGISEKIDDNELLKKNSDGLGASLLMMVVENIELQYESKSVSGSEASKLAIELVKGSCIEEQLALKMECIRLRSREVLYKQAEEIYEEKIKRLIKIHKTPCGLETAIETIEQRVDELNKLVDLKEAADMKSEVEKLKNLLEELEEIVGK